MPKKKSTPIKNPVKSSKSKAGEYKAAQITVLEGLDPVKKRPGMYIGSTGQAGLHHMLWEVVDNGIDEAMAGYATEVSVTLLPDNMIEVSDNGRGIPVDKHKQAGVSALEVVMTKLHAGGKFGQGGYKVSGGLHGVGVSVVNALSTYMKAEVHRDGKVWVQEYNQGKPKKKVHSVGATKRTGTVITFQPDANVFETLEYNWETILNHFRQQAYLTKGIKIKIFDEREKDSFKSYEFYFEGGIKSYVSHLNHNNQPKHENVFYIEKSVMPTNGAPGLDKDTPINIEIAFQYIDEYKESVYAFANNIINPEGGMHVMGFRSALTRVLNNYARNKGYLKEKDDNLSGEDTREGLTAVISIKVAEPQFEGQTKAKLGNPEVRTVAESVFSDALEIYLEEHPRDAECIIGKCLLSSQARRAARQARESILRKGALEGLTLPGKLADCSSRDAEKSEIYIVEGDSAGGCFSGETEVALADGRNLSFRDLVVENKQGKKNYCYTINEEGNIVIAPIKHPCLTKKDAKVIKVAIDNGKEIICTPDHKFKLVDGSYIEAQNLTLNMSLAPLYRKISKREGRITIKGYEMVWDYKSKKWIFTHLLADRYNIDNGVYKAKYGEHKHHVDFNKLNNNPENIIRMSSEDHLMYHVNMAHKTIHREDVKEKCKKIKQTPEYREKARKKSLEKKELFSKNAKKQWENEEYKEFMKKKYLEFYYSNEEYRKKSLARIDKAQRKYWSKSVNRGKQAERVKQFFVDNPEQRDLLSSIAKKQWSDIDLKKWRAEKTKEQWTAEFRKKRKTAYNKTYYYYTINFIKRLWDQKGSLNSYEEARCEKRNTNLLKMETFVSKFFKEDYDKMIDTVKHYNHKVKKIIHLRRKADVYDLEVENTNNFALASGVFVHNSSKQGRNREFQAILPLRGKVLNVERARLDKMLSNNEIKSLIIAFGTNIGEQFDISKLRYHKIIIMTDADVDGSHIRTLLLTFFYRYFPELVRLGHIYIAQPPLYKIQKGREAHWVFTDSEKDKIIKKMGGSMMEEAMEEEESIKTPGVGERVAGINIQRYKGLGEMNPEQLWETTMDPETRIMWQVKVEDASAADEVFEMLMGAEVLPRKKFIQTHAKDVKNLDA
ncbi:MAG: DNA topoisomerase (ATP-hydrolyzing) subunit B [Candidatus Kuenenbacteria bacterium]